MVRADKYGFPRGKAGRIKRAFGFSTGDVVKLIQPAIIESLSEADYARARRLVNGGRHGLDRFTATYLKILKIINARTKLAGENNDI